MKLKKLSVLLFAVGITLCGSGLRAHAAETSGVTQDTAQEAADAETEITKEAAEPEATQKPVEPEQIEEKEEQKEPEVLVSVSKPERKQKAAAKEEAYSKADLRLMAAIIYCESGWEPYAGKLAVGIVVKNRQESRRFPNTIKGVVYQPYQFGPARNGALSKALAQYDAGKFNSAAEKECIRAAKEALSGEKSVSYRGKSLNLKGFYYFSGRVSGARLSIANHQFK